MRQSFESIQMRITLRINLKTRLIQSTYIIIIFISLIFHLREEQTL